MLGEKRRQLSKELDVFGQLLTQVRTLHFDHYASSIAQLGGMYLTQASASQWLRIEGLEELTDAGVQLLFDALLDLLERHLRNIVLKVLQLLDVRPRQQIGTGRKHLTQLDVSRSELDQPVTERLCFASEIALRLLSIIQTGSVEAQKPLAVGEVAQAVVGKEPYSREQAWKMLRRENHAYAGGRKYAHIRSVPRASTSSHRIHLSSGCIGL